MKTPRGGLPAVSWPWAPACGSLEPPRRDGENAQKTGKNGGKMGEIWCKTCEQGKDRRDQLVGRAQRFVVSRGVFFVSGVEMFKKLLDRGEAGDNIGCLLVRNFD